MNGWKVLGMNDRRSCGVSNTSYGLEYPIGVAVFPKIEGSKLFFFKNRKDAKSFVSTWPIYKIVPCIAKGCYKAKYMSRCTSLDKSFWQNGKKKRSRGNNSMPVPQGTWFAKSITCLE